MSEARIDEDRGDDTLLMLLLLLLLLVIVLAKLLALAARSVFRRGLGLRGVVAGGERTSTLSMSLPVVAAADKLDAGGLTVIHP